MYWQPWMGAHYHVPPTAMGAIFIVDYVEMWVDVSRAAAAREAK